MKLLGTLATKSAGKQVAKSDSGNGLLQILEEQGFEKYSHNGISVYFGGLLYNSDELEAYGAYTNWAHAVYNLFLKKSYQGFVELNGKALVLVEQGNELFVFRDHWGEGPMFFYTNRYFATSMDALLSHDPIEAQVNELAMHSFLRYGFNPAPLTLFDGVSKLPAGYVLHYRGKHFELINLFDYQEFKSLGTLKISMEEAVEEYARLLKQSIRRRIRGFDTVGALLSGGYDSGGNIAVLRELFPGKIKSYSIGFKDNPFSELPYAAMMAKAFESEHHEYLMEQKDVESLPQAIRAFGEPFSESGFMLNNAAMRFVKDEQLPVIIGGDGNDQMMGTTGKELALHFLIRKKGLRFAQRMFSRVANNGLFDKDNLLFKLRFHNEKVLHVMRPDNFGFNRHLSRLVFKHVPKEEHPVFAAIPDTYKDFEDFHDKHNFYLDIRHSINEVILNKASRLSVYYGNNLGFTYIDRDIYNFIKQLPLSLRLKGTVDEVAKGRGVTKYIHKYYTKPLLPKEVTERKKQGGFSPLAIFFKDKDFRAQVYRYIENSDFAAIYARPAGLKKFLIDYEAAADGPSYWFWYKQLKSNQLINLLILALWWDIYLNKRVYDSVYDYLK